MGQAPGNIADVTRVVPIVVVVKMENDQYEKGNTGWEKMIIEKKRKEQDLSKYNNVPYQCKKS